MIDDAGLDRVDLRLLLPFHQHGEERVSQLQKADFGFQGGVLQEVLRWSWLRLRENQTFGRMGNISSIR